jgi:hypothetical protein
MTYIIIVTIKEMPAVLVTFCHYITKDLRETKKEGFILAHNFRDFSSWSHGSVGFGPW